MAEKPPTKKQLRSMELARLKAISDELHQAEAERAEAQRRAREDPNGAYQAIIRWLIVDDAIQKAKGNAETESEPAGPEAR